MFIKESHFRGCRCEYLCCIATLHSHFPQNTHLLTFYKEKICLCTWTNYGFCKCGFLCTLNII